MSPLRLVGIILVIAGIAGIVVPRITYTKEKHSADLGPLSVSVTEKDSVNVPQWAGIAAIVVGAGLLLFPGKKS
jgi:drug/metabolite transporter (DMT)-like permease